MAVKTFYILGTTASTPYWGGSLQDGGSAPAGANTAFGCVVAKIATTSAFHPGRIGATTLIGSGVNSATSFIAATSGPTKGTSTTSTTVGDSFTIGPYTGVFANTAWTFAWNMRAATTAGSSGRLRMRVWKSANQDGTSPTELTASAQVGAICALSTSADTNSSMSWSPGAKTLTNEYLFFQVEWEVTTAGSSNGCDVCYRVGTSSITTPDLATQIIYTLAEATGTYALSGSAAAVKATRKLAGVTGTYALSGSTATLIRKYVLSEATGAYALTGSALTPKRDLRFPEATGTYALTGQTATVLLTRKLAAASGTYALTGSAATVFATRKLAGVTGTYFLTGSTAPLKRTFPLALASGAYSLTGSASATFVTRKLAAATGSFALTGSAATVLATRKLAAASGAYSLTGSAAQVFATRKLAGVTGAYVVNGQTATLVLTPGSGGATFTLAGDTGQFTLSGNTGTLVFTSSTIGPLYTVSGPQVVGYLPLQDGIEQVRAVNFPGSTVQRQTATGPTSGGSTNALLTNITTDHLLLNGSGILLLT